VVDQLDFTGRVVIVTGGGKGVGRGITKRFLEQGAEVVICGRSEPDAPVEAGGRAARFIAADVREVEQIAAVVEFTTGRLGRLDVLVNNVGGAPKADAATVSPRFTESIVRLNMLAPINFAQAANAVMQEQDGGGAIVNISSVSGIRPSPGTAAYGAAKAGLLSFTTTVAVEWAPKVRVNAITAGMIRTEQAHLHYGNEDDIRAVGETVPLGRLGMPEEVGDACLFLASPLSSYMSGANLLLHGGGENPAFLSAAMKNIS
jgi:NAD(P)-dependent dehydrogenase (short-subunit alcohol dehydrogenase family)